MAHGVLLYIVPNNFDNILWTLSVIIH